MGAKTSQSLIRTADEQAELLEHLKALRDAEFMRKWQREINRNQTIIGGAVVADIGLDAADAHTQPKPKPRVP